MTARDLDVVEPLVGVLLEGFAAGEVGFEERGFLVVGSSGGEQGGGRVDLLV